MECWESNSGLLDEKQVCYLCAIQPPPLPKPCTSARSVLCLCVNQYQFSSCGLFGKPRPDAIISLLCPECHKLHLGLLTSLLVFSSLNRVPFLGFDLVLTTSCPRAD